MTKKNWLLSPWGLVLVFVIAAAILVLCESLKENLFQGILAPWQSVAITIIVAAAIVTCVVFLIRRWGYSVHVNELELEFQQNSQAYFQLTLSAANHIINNVLNYLQLIRLDISEDGKVNEENLQLLEKSIEKARKQMAILNTIQSPEKPESYKGIFPDS